MPLDDLTMSALGGGAWAALKVEEGKFPDINAVRGAKFWKRADVYKQAVWSWLCDESGGSAVATADLLETQKGHVISVDILAAGRKETILFGDVGPIMSSRTEAAVVMADLGTSNDVFADELRAMVEHCVKQRNGVKLILWGMCHAVQALVSGPLDAMMGAGGCLQGYRYRILNIHLPRDDPLPAKPTWCFNVKRAVLLVTPGTFRSCYDFVVTHQQWTPSLVKHFLHVLDASSLALFVLHSA